MSPTILPEQANALVELFRLDGALAMDVAPDSMWSLRVVLYFNNPDETAPPAAARFFSVSCAGTIREIAPTPEQVAA